MSKFKKLPKGWPCKPCWELKYCPYGPLVEFFPLIDRDHPKDFYWGSQDVTGWVHESHLALLASCDPEEISCNVFGHVCPVFAMAESMTETEQIRYSGRAVPRDVMLKVVRRDNYTCQTCHDHVPDNEIELDHVIPRSKGGATTVENLRLLCRSCNRKRSNSTSDFLVGGQASKAARGRKI